MKLAIMTRGRVNAQNTVKYIPEDWRDSTYFICPPEEMATLTQRYGILAIPFFHPAPSQSTKFQWLLEYNCFPNEEKVVILDDDLLFSRRITRDDGSVGLKQIDDLTDMMRMLALMEDYLDEVPLCGLHPRQMGHQSKLPYKTNGKVITVYGVNRKLLQDYGFGTRWRVDYLPIFGDVFLNCHLLDEGADVRLMTTYFVDWKASQAPGGCSIYRTMEMQEQAVDKLIELFGPFAKKVIKTPKSSKWLGDSRVDFTVQWQRLAQQGKAKRNARLLESRSMPG